MSDMRAALCNSKTLIKINPE